MSLSMGLDSSKPNQTDTHKTEQALCTTTYRSFHSEGEAIPPPFSILKELKHSGPLGTDQMMKVTACAFSPNDDTSLVSLTTFAGLDLRHFRAGFVQSWDLDSLEETHDNSLFTYSPRPVCNFSPDGEIVSFILNTGHGQIILAEHTEDRTLEPFTIDCDTGGYGDRSLLSRALCCVFSPNGLKAVTVSNVTLESHRGSETNEICLWQVISKKKLKSTWRVSCEVVFPGFTGHLVSCVFSPDSSLVAFSSSLSQLYVLKSENLELLSAIRTDVARNACSCLFVPCFPFQKLAACYEDGVFQIWYIQDGNTKCVTETKIVTGSTKLTAFTYSPDGSLLAFGTSQGKVIVTETEMLQTLYEISSVPDTRLDSVSNEPSTTIVCSVAFARSCNQLAIGQSDGLVRIWQLPLKFELQHLCRLVINGLVPPSQVTHLPLPRNLKAYLLFSPLTSTS
ncbi:uncharacterized protein LOC111330551 [Stylophora pistillata]|nr:uncharacterized protein LOC111330551 [Stylophora pistillata]